MGCFLLQYSYCSIVEIPDQDSPCVQDSKYTFPLKQYRLLQKFEVSPDGKFIAVCGRFGDIHILQARTKEWTGTLKMNSEVTAVCFNPSGSQLWSHGGENRTTSCIISVWVSFNESLNLIMSLLINYSTYNVEVGGTKPSLPLNQVPNEPYKKINQNTHCILRITSSIRVYISQQQN